MYAEIIADGKHLPPDLIRMILKIKGNDHVILCTDSLALAGTEVTSGKTLGTEFIIEDGVCKLKDRSAFAGSIATADKMISVMTKDVGLSVPAAVKLMTDNPARLLGLRKGTIKNEFTSASEYALETTVSEVDRHVKDVRKAISYGVSTYLMKPIDFHELSSSLLNVKKKLDSQYNDSGVQDEDEDVQLVFSDLISGIITSEEELFTRFQLLPLSGTPNDYRGLLITITIDREDISKWNYGKEKLASELLKSVRTILPDYRCYHLFRSGPRYFFIVLTSDTVPNLSVEMLENVLFHLVHFNCKVYISASFGSLSELGAFRQKKEDDIPLLSTNLESTDGHVNVENEDIIIQRAISFIRTNYQTDLTRKDVAYAVFLSPAYFSRFFKEKTNMTFIDYLTMVRMQNAELLLSTNMKIAEIAQKVGYQSHNRFVINFKEFSGYTPTEYRIQLLKKEIIGGPNEENKA